MRWTVHGERVALREHVDAPACSSTSSCPTAHRFDHHVLRTPNHAAGAVVHDPDRGVLLLWRHRFITDPWGWEIPAGRVDARRVADRRRRPGGRGGDRLAPGAAATAVHVVERRQRHHRPPLRRVHRRRRHPRRRAGRRLRGRAGRVAAVHDVRLAIVGRRRWSTARPRRRELRAWPSAPSAEPRRRRSRSARRVD